MHKFHSQIQPLQYCKDLIAQDLYSENGSTCSSVICMDLRTIMTQSICLLKTVPGYLIQGIFIDIIKLAWPLVLREHRSLLTRQSFKGQMHVVLNENTFCHTNLWNVCLPTSLKDLGVGDQLLEQVTLWSLSCLWASTFGPVFP